MNEPYERVKAALRAARDAAAQSGVRVSGSETPTTVRLRLESPDYLAEVVVWSNGTLTVTVADIRTGEYVCEGSATVNDADGDALLTRMLLYFDISWVQFRAAEAEAPHPG